MSISEQSTWYVVVDDSDPRVQYGVYYKHAEEEKPWIQEVNSSMATNNLGYNGQAYNHTLTRKASYGGYIDFTFNGTWIGFYGSLRYITSSNHSSWSCFLDDQRIGSWREPVGLTTNYWPFCNTSVVAAGEHSFKLYFDDGSYSDDIFWFDQVRFVPSEPVLAGETIYVDDNDPSVSYSPPNNFNRSGDNVHLTDVPGSSITLRFTGTSASFYAKSEPGKPDSKGHYAIDGQSPVNFNIPGTQVTGGLYNQELFHTPDLSPTEHTLVITFDGQRGNTPLSVDYFYVTLPARAPVSGPGSPGQQIPHSGKQSTPVGAIVGGAVGGVIALLALILFGIFSRRRHQRSTNKQGSDLKEASPILPTLSGHTNNRTSHVVDTSSGPDAVLPVGVAPTSGVPSSVVSTLLQKQERGLETFTRRGEREVVHHVDSGFRSADRDESGPGGSTIEHVPPQYTEN